MSPHSARLNCCLCRTHRRSVGPRALPSSPVLDGPVACSQSAVRSVPSSAPPVPAQSQLVGGGIRASSGALHLTKTFSFLCPILRTVRAAQVPLALTLKSFLRYMSRAQFRRCFARRVVSARPSLAPTSRRSTWLRSLSSWKSRPRAWSRVVPRG
ncbi:hypothetical protein B0H13DRAFT_2671914 [Mycena leptocephala]|nr:hypothetical protein B0H13DRAFT_2671914 [Mycena leptocephala]